MKAICVTESRNLELRDIPSPSAPPSGYINVRIAAASINHGDKTFLKRPPSALAALASGARLSDVWGASASGTVEELGPDIPSNYLGRKVAIYRGLKPNDAVLGLWCETVQMPYQTCLLLPDNVDAKDYSGSLVNVVTAYAFIEQVVAEGHRGIIVTAGSSATGRALAVLARGRGIPFLAIVRSEEAKEALKREVEVEHVFNSSHPDFMRDLEQKAQELGTTAVFDGVGGTLIGRILGALPPRSSIFFYGFLSGQEKVEFQSAVFMMKDITMKRFSNFNTVTVQEKLGEMLKDLESCIEDFVFKTSIGKAFEPEDIQAAMEYNGGSKKAMIVFSR
ncbi:NAD(P)-binding protein [Mollisia scopiformis]|uniref:NAD(P)-binding protein n=1 Tax=Mollisia scopiformis TaxID=149040 RepID=A0A194XKR4_MOLSC|nr:NAD(P)-binding protein [Mollisia scopiformis]KUJ20768.1 NAD(P)-binding protein [Mollisia scopiformis]